MKCTPEIEDKIRNVVTGILSWAVIIIIAIVVSFIAIVRTQEFFAFCILVFLIFCIALFILWVSGEINFCRKAEDRGKKDIMISDDEFED